MRYWMLIMWAGCGQMYPAPGGQPQPAPPEPITVGDPGRRSPSHGPADPGQRSPNHGPADPYAASRTPAPPAPAPPVPAPPAPAPPAPASRASPAVSSEAQAMVEAHNRVRAKHCASPLAWSPKLAQVAQRWANSLRDKGCRFGHSNGSYGENLAAGSTGLLDAEAVVKMWYDEGQQYKFPNGGFSMQTGHFTQVVWRGTTQVGCGRAQCKGMDIWVCEYDPAGNWEGQYAANVRPPGCR